ncbi:hypothetical protein [Shewanella sp. MBTL60-007]|uniref:hypothetical protein n=1 Tax=Shewanella sp. MBTL60-007 TaxID=2815911 RepID=UPI001BBA6F31|nr:hypothetical protein [Shewanella sp. MBTL60-007]GIU22239.1 hypothetical protein TUM3792_24120 [Shewanella sp. MBTL60-007]
MIKKILDRLKMVDGAVVREGFYAQSVAKEQKFIFLQPYTDEFGATNGNGKYRDDLVLQVVAGIQLTRAETPTSDLLNLVHEIRTAFYKGERDASKPSWLKDKPLVLLKEVEPCKYIMPEANEKHGLAVITLSITQTVEFGEKV